MYIACDFDGTCVEHKYPDVGKDVPHAVRTLKDLVKQGHQLILWTMRSDKESDGIYYAVKWFEKHEIPLYGINHNPNQDSWTNSPKAYANIYLDDAAFGAPLIQPKNKCERPYLDWLKVREYFELGE